MAQDNKSDANGEGQKISSSPSVSLPKGGGAIRGIGEKFAANPATGTGSMSVPIAVSPGRSGFGPQLSLSYDSGAGNGPFGFGWALSLPQITRKTDKGLPQYHYVEEPDVFVLSGAEDLVPVLVKQNGKWVPETLPDRAIGTDTYTVHRYRPRIEGLFARIERWTRDSDGDVHWRSISTDNILTLYGKDSNSRITDAVDPLRVFTWLICETRDDKGNAVLYEYKPEDGIGVDLTRAHERNRGDRNDSRRATNRYLKHIRYGNRLPLLDNAGQRPRLLTDTEVRNAGWMFEVVLDYGEHDAHAPKPDEAGPWIYRNDSFSTYRAGFEVRTTRLCQRVLMFHHFPGEAEVGSDCLVRSTDFTYSHEQDPASTCNPIYTFLLSVTQSGYKRSNGGYLKRSLPPVEYEYTQPIVQDTVQEVDAASLENLPIGVDDATHQWTDLHGEGIPGILTEQAAAWFYKRNISPISERPVELAPLERVAAIPCRALAGKQAQFMDLAGDGRLDLVVLDGPMPGLYEHDEEEGWQPFRPFTSRLNRDMRDPNLKFVDLDGDGHADVLVSEDDAFVWHASLAEHGFGPARRVHQTLDEEKGPRLVFADGTQSIYLADLSGDGLTDLVRIRNGEVCYWPNLGYGRFGAKVTMDDAPHFDHPDQFDHKRIRLADIDGTGTTDIIYLHRDGVRLYFNQSGNNWSAPQVLSVFPRVDDLVSIVPTDLLGNGTACLVWSSPLPGDAQRQMRYVDLMGGQKPHLLVKTVNNLGAETRVQYAPSTKFYLQDKRDGNPWITRLPFPVHVVEKVTVKDKWRNTCFSTSYSYRHGYFDGEEREFRGFGRVEQLDSESFGEFSVGNEASPYVTGDRTLYQPPVKTITWFHTGAFLGRERILRLYQKEYFPNWLDEAGYAIDPDDAFVERALPEPDLVNLDLSPEEWREALRACKGVTLRQEVYELDMDALEAGRHVPVKLFSTACHNCHIRRMQPQDTNPHAVFLVTESEALTYHYELELREQVLRPDPRIAHILILSTNEYGQPLQTAAVGYPRVRPFRDADPTPTLPAGLEGLVRGVQNEIHLAYTETHYTNDVNDEDHYRLRVPCEVSAYELIGIRPDDEGDRATTDPWDDVYFTLDELRDYRLSETYQDSGVLVESIPYHHLPDRINPQKRVVERVRTLYFGENLVDPLPFGELNYLGLLYETYKLALTGEMLTAVLGDKLTPPVLDALSDSRTSGYLSGNDLETRFAPESASNFAGPYWIRSGIAGFADDATEHFYLPERYTDPFGHTTVLQYDIPYDLYPRSSTDPLGNTTEVTRFDFRVLAPAEIRDANNNLSEVYFDALGLPAAVALKGKGAQADSLAGFDDTLANPENEALIRFFSGNSYDEAEARRLLGNATMRYVYFFGEEVADGAAAWGRYAASACTIMREKHVAQLGQNDQSRLQTAFEYTDGLGAVIVKKIQAEPEPGSQGLRWIASGKTILNNKGKPVKQYEPYFSETEHRFDEDEAQRETGVTPIMFYDAPGRLIRTELPDGSFGRVAFSPWFAATYDLNDTVLEPVNTWYARNSAPDASSEARRCARLTAVHADTPGVTHLDSLAREVVAVAHNRCVDNEGTTVAARYVTFTRLDAEGKPLWVRDSRGNRVMQYITPPIPEGQLEDPPRGYAPCYDIAGNLLFQHSIDAGDRWMLNDAAGKPLRSWDSRDHVFRTTYDALRRPTHLYVQRGNGTEVLVERTIYGETLGQAAAETNHRGRVYQHYDQAGVVTSENFDFKGNLLRSRRQLAVDYKTTLDWSVEVALEEQVFAGSTTYDALNRPVSLTTPDNSVIRPEFNEANLLNAVRANLRGADIATEFIRNIDYNAKGQRLLIEYGNGAITTYEYDEEIFRLIRLQTVRSGTTQQDLRYTHDPVGNITHIQDDADIQNTSYFRNQRVEPSADYEYDAIYRLISATGREHLGQIDGQRNPPTRPDAFNRFHTGLDHPGNGRAMGTYIESYEYDEVGNILFMRHRGADPSHPGWKRCYQYALDSNRLLSTDGPDDLQNPDSPCATHYAATPINTERYDYDAHGNMIAIPRVPLMRWNYRDQLQATSQQVVNNGGTPEITYYVYDATGQRVRKVTEGYADPGQTPTQKEESIYLGGFEVYRKYNGNGNTVTLERETLHIMNDKQRIALVETKTINFASPLTPHPSRIRYQFGNHLGSATLELDDQAQVISYEEYYPYGSTSYQAMRSGVQVSPKRYRYTGMERDEESGFNFHGARYYAPWLGRWTSCDRSGIKDDTNVYVYARNNPPNLIDVTGLTPTPLERRLGGPSGEELVQRYLESPYPSDDPNLIVLSSSGDLVVRRTAEVDNCRRGSGSICDPIILQRYRADTTRSSVRARTALGGAANTLTGGVYGEAAPSYEAIGHGDYRSAFLSLAKTAVLRGMRTNPTGAAIATISEALPAVVQLVTDLSSGDPERTAGALGILEGIGISAGLSFAFTAALGSPGAGGAQGTGHPPPTSRIVSPIFRYGERDIAIVETSVGRQAFYRSTGINSGMRGRWLPFDEIVYANDWFNKWSYTEQGGIPAGDPLHRFGTQEFRDISDALAEAQISQGGSINSARDVNRILDFFRARRTPFNLERPVTEP